jgi:streptogramin lyase
MRTALLVSIALLLTSPARALTLAPGDLVAIGRPVGSSVRALYKIDPATGAHTFLSATVGRDVAVGRDGYVYVVQSGSTAASNAIRRIDPATGAATVVATGLVQPTGIDVDPSGRLVTDDASGIRYTDPVTGSATFVTWGVDGQGFVMNPQLAAAGLDGTVFTLRFFASADEVDINGDPRRYAEFVSVALGGAVTVLGRFALSDYAISPIGVAAGPDGQAYYTLGDPFIGTLDLYTLPGFSPNLFHNEWEAAGFAIAVDADGDVLLGCHRGFNATACLANQDALLVRLTPTAAGFVRSDLPIGLELDAIAVVPVPEPGTLLLAGLGLAALAKRRPRRA